MKVLRYEIEEGKKWARTLGDQGSLLEPFYRMCLRYSPSFFFEENVGNTIYHLTQEDRSLLFAFSKRKDTYSVLYLVYRKEQRQEAWLRVMDDLAQIRREAGRGKRHAAEGDRIFEENLEKLQRDVNWSLRPFSFIISSLPALCFPAMEGLRYYTPAQGERIELENIMVPLHAGDSDAKVYEDYDLMRETTLREARRLGKGAEWEVHILDRKNRKLLRKLSEPVKSSSSDTFRLLEMEEAAMRLWEKAGRFK